MKGRQFAAEIERVGLRLQLRKAQAEAGDIVLLYGDESEALTHPYLARAWAKRGADLRVPAPGQAKKVAMMGTLDHVTRKLFVHTSPTKRSTDFIAHLEQLDGLYGPKLGHTRKPSCWSRTTVQSTSASSPARRSRRASIGSPSSGCPNTPPSSTTSRLSGTISRLIISLHRRSARWRHPRRLNRLERRTKRRSESLLNLSDRSRIPQDVQ